VDLGTEKAPGTKLAKSNFQLPTSNFLFLKTEGHVFSNPLYKLVNPCWQICQISSFIIMNNKALSSSGRGGGD
jgi:hypothetical protein